MVEGGAKIGRGLDQGAVEIEQNGVKTVTVRHEI
jgi:hypothetical protein